MISKFWTDLVGASILHRLMYLGGWPFFIAMTIAMLLGLQEFYSNIRRKGIYAFELGGWLCGMGIFAATWFVS